MSNSFQQLLDYAKKNQLGSDEIGTIIGIFHASAIQFALSQLENQTEFLKSNEFTSSVDLTQDLTENPQEAIEKMHQAIEAADPQFFVDYSQEFDTLSRAFLQKTEY